MAECDYCGEEFDSEEELHVHWGDEHEDDINSHEKEKVKKARRKQEEQKGEKMRQRKKMAGWGLAAVLGLGFLALVGPQLVNSIGSSGSADFNLEGQPYMGEADAPVNVVAFEDYKCPHCASFEAQAKPQLVQNHVETGEAKFYMINFPILGGESRQAARAAECVYEQDQDEFWNFHSALFRNQRSLEITTDSLVNLAQQNTEGLNYDDLRQCISSGATQSQVREDQRIGRSNGVSSTPTVFVNGERVSDWSYPNLKAKIQTALQQ